MKLPKFLTTEIKLPKPQLKLRRTPKPKPVPTEKAPKPAPKRQPRVPRFAEDLYRDLRDRRLLLPALALIVALVAVPMLLTKSKEPAPQAATAALPEGSEAVAPAVLTEQPAGVRDYRERLGGQNSKNPFASDEPSSGTGDSATGDSPGDPTVGTGTPTPSSTTADAPARGVSSPPASGNTEPEVLILAPRVDVTAGKFGKTKDIEGVELGDLVPDQRRAPVAVLIGVSEDLESATFLVSEDVTKTNGDGSCHPRANDCEFLRLADGEKRTFVYGPHERKYAIKVTEIREEIVDRRKVADGSAASAG